MWRTTRFVPACVATAAALSVLCAAEVADKPKDIGLVEKAGTRLVQIDLSVSKRDGSPVDIQPTDLEVRVGKSLIRNFSLDRVCSSTETTGNSIRSPAGTPTIASYLFYFDESQLTYAGRARAIDVARELVRTLIVGGNRGMVISNGRDLLALSSLTNDSRELLAAIDRLQRDTSRQERFAEEESARVAGLEAATRAGALEAKEQDSAYKNIRSVEEEGLNCQGPNRDPLCQFKGSAAFDKDNRVRTAGADRTASLFTRGTWRAVEGLAKDLQRQEMRRADASLERFRLALLRLVPVKAPKAVVYFADAMRLNAGEHYLRSVSKVMEQEGVFAGNRPEFIRSDGIRDVAGSFDQVVSMAGRVGARVYAVLAQGTSADSGGLRDAKDALSSLAVETGGEAFLEGIDSSAIAGGIADDMECVYLVSFEPKGLPEDQSLLVRIQVTPKDAIVRTRSRIVIPSEKAVVDARRLAAFVNPRANGAALTLGLIPAGCDGKKYSGLFQLAIPDGGPTGTVWAVSAAIIANGSVLQEFDRTVTTQQNDQPLIVEHMLDLPPGSYQVVALAENASLGVLHSGQLETALPKSEETGVTVTAPVALQPQSGWFLRDDTAPRPTGPVIRADGEPMRAELPTALVGYVCRSKGEKGALNVERRLVGQSAITFPPISLEPSGDRCAQVRDVIPAGMLGDGNFLYMVTVSRGLVPLAKTQRQVVVAKAASGPPAPR